MARRTDPETAKIKATVDSQSRPYTDPRADYPIARQVRNVQKKTEFK